MPGMRVLDADVYIGCHHLLALKVRYQLTLAGIERATFGADPENLDLPCSYRGAAEVADRWRHLRYLTRRGNFYSQKYPHPRLALIPATPMYQGCVSGSSQLSSCDDLDPNDDVLLLVDGGECLTQRLRKRIHLNSHTARVTGVHARVLTCLLPLWTFPYKTSRSMSRWEMSGVAVLGSCHVVSTGRLAIWCAVRCRWFG